MAGYIIYSLDGEKFQQFVEQADDATLATFADIFSQTMDEYYDEFEKDDPLRDWPVDPGELAPKLKQRLTSPDWYEGFSNTGKAVWESSLQNLCMDDTKLLGFDCESDGVYWDVIDLIRAHHGIKPNAVTDLEISHFGMRPYRYTPDSSLQEDFYSWHPNHSMHEAADVARILEQVKAAKSAVMNSDDENAKEEYEEELVPALEKVAASKRVLFIGVDT